MLTEPNPAASPELAVWGSPIGHSRSPELHRAALRVLGSDWSYGRREMTEADFAAAIAERSASARGLSLTMPLKYVAAAAAAELDEAAELSGAVNTLYWEERGSETVLRGFNTDIPGTVRALNARVPQLGGHAEILGGGATAGSLLIAVSRLGMTSARLLVRSPERATATRELGERVGLSMSVGLLEGAVLDPEAGLIVSTLPGGSAISLEIPETLRRRVPLFDVAYSPWPSTLAALWAQSEGTVISGLEMLVHQALIQERIFHTGEPTTPLPHEAEVLAAMLGAVGL